MKREPTSLRAYALDALARREHSPVELAQKLRRRARNQLSAGAALADDEAGTSVFHRSSERSCDESQEREIEELLAWLTEQGFLSAGRFVESRVASRSSRWGQARIRQELKAHGLSLDDETAQSLTGSECARATEVWSRRFGHRSNPGDSLVVDARERARQQRFLASRGFGSDVIRRVMSNHPSDVDEVS